MKDDLPSYRDRLLARVRPEFRPEAERFLRSYSHNPNEPIFWFFAMLVEEQALTRAEVEKQKWLIHAIADPQTWKRLIVSKLTGWIVVPVVLAAALISSLAYLNHNNTVMIRKLSEHPEEVAAYAKDTLRALEVANDNAASINAIADLLNVPEARAGLWNGQFIIVVPNNSIAVEPYNENQKRITFNGDFRKIFGHFQKVQDDANEKKPTSP